MINYSFKTELTKERTIYTDIVFTTGDIRGYRLNFSFFENGKQVNIKNHVLTVKAKRADGVIVTDAGTVKDDYTAYIDIKNSMICKSGEVSFEIALSDDTGMYVTTKEIVAVVRKGYGEDGITPTDTAPVISSLLSAASTLSKSANEVDSAIQTANEGAENANTAAQNANSSAITANEAALQAQTSAKNANIAAQNAKNAVANMDTLLVEGTLKVIPGDTIFDIVDLSVSNSNIIKAFSEGRKVELKIKDSRLPEGQERFYYGTSNIVSLPGLIYWHIHSLTKCLLVGLNDIEGFPFWTAQEEDVASIDYVDTQVGNTIENALENIITKYGLGGDSV